MTNIAIGYMHIGIAILMLIILSLSFKGRTTIYAIKKLFLLYLTFSIMWVLCNAMKIFVSSPCAIIFWHEAKFIGVLPIPPILLSFTLIYTQKKHWLNKITKSCMWIIPVITLLSIITDSKLHMFREEIKVLFLNDKIQVITDNGLLYWINAGYSYIIIIGSLILLLLYRQTLPKHYRLQPTVLAISMSFPFFINLVYVFSLLKENYDLTALGFIFSSMIFYWAIFHFSTPEIIPTARNLIVENMDNLLLVVDIHGNVIDLNAATKNLIKKYKIQIKNNTFEELFNEFLLSTNGYITEESGKKIIVVKVDNQIKYYSYEESPIVENHYTIGKLIIFNNITDLKNMMLKLKEMATIDPLTGLYNRIYGSSYIEELDIKNHLPISILKGGLNGIKMINDTFGSHIGDTHIIKTADILKDIFSKTGVIIRSGGDEYTVFLLNTDEKKAQEYISKAINICESTSIGLTKLSLCMSYSTMSSMDDSIVEHVKEANNNMYRKKMTESQSTRSSIIESLKMALEQSDYETKAHAERTQKLALKVGKEIGLSENKLSDLSLLAVLHDIGKIAISDSILLKSSKLTDEEFEIIKTHTEKGYSIALASPELISIAKGILHHHEKFDGSGYPSGLKGLEIPIESRVIAIVDAYDVMTNDRPYHKAISKEAAMAELIRCKGTHFDPDLVDVMLHILNK